MKLSLSLLAVTAAVLVAPCALHAQVVTQWNFDNTTPATSGPSTGAGTLTLLGGITSLAGTGSPEDTGTPNNSLRTTTYPAASVGSGTAGVEFSASTATLSGPIQISLDLYQSGTASMYLQLELSSDGTTFAAPTVGTAAVNGPFNGTNTMTSFSNSGLYSNNAGSGTQNFVEGVTFTLPAGSVYASDPNFAFEFVTVFNPTPDTSYSAASTTSTYAPTGNIRFDEVTLGVPEPSTYALMLAAGLGLALVYRRSRARV